MSRTHEEVHEEFKAIQAVIEDLRELNEKLGMECGFAIPLEVFFENVHLVSPAKNADERKRLSAFYKEKKYKEEE